MIKIILFLAVFMLSELAFAQAPRQAERTFEKAVFANRNREKLPYRLLYPGTLQAGQKYPLVLFLHGAGSQGDDNESHLGEVPQMLLKASSHSDYGCFVLAPQCPKEDAWVWFPKYPLCASAPEPSKSSRLTFEIIDSLVQILPIDPRRIYVTGLSLGGEGSFDLITRRPHFFAAAVPVCGIADTAKADLMKSTPLWIFHGDRDDINPVDYSRNMVKALREKGANPIYTEYEGVEHDSWTMAYQEPKLLDWIFSQKLKKHP